MNHILREIKLSKLTGIPMSAEASKLVKFWDELWSDMKVSVDPTKGKIKCWKDGYSYNNYFYQNNKGDNLWCDYDKVWSFFRYELKLNHDETQELIQHVVDMALKCKVNTPSSMIGLNIVRVDMALKCKVNTPLPW